MRRVRGGIKPSKRMLEARKTGVMPPPEKKTPRPRFCQSGGREIVTLSVRIDPNLHSAIKMMAEKNHRSLTAEIELRLKQSF